LDELGPTPGAPIDVVLVDVELDQATRRLTNDSAARRLPLALEAVPDHHEQPCELGVCQRAAFIEGRLSFHS
jgi:hypothetical protein